MLPALRALRPDRERQRRRRAGNGGARHRHASTPSTGHPVARRLRPGHVPRTPSTGLRAAGLRRARRAPRSRRSTNGFAGTGERRPDPARRGARAHDDVRPTPRTATSSRPRRSTSAATQLHARARLRLDAGRRGRRRRRPRSGRLARDPRKSYEAGWIAYDAGLKAPPTKLPGLVEPRARSELADAYYLSANVLKASEDKTFPGAIVASLRRPGARRSRPATPQHVLRLVPRGLRARPLRGVDRPRRRRRPGHGARRGDCSSSSGSSSRRLDAAQQPPERQARARLVRHAARRDRLPDPDGRRAGHDRRGLYRDHVKPAANFVASHGPAFGVERWEEQGGFSPSTIAAEIAGLIAAADLADANGDAVAAVWRGVADDFQRRIKDWTVTTNGPLAAHPYFIRLSKTGDPNAAISYNVGNGGPTLDQRAVIDAGFLELSRLGGCRPAIRTSSSRCRSSTRRSARPRRAARAGTATTATATATAPATAGPGRRRGKGPATSGRCSPPSAASMRSDG